MVRWDQHTCQIILCMGQTHIRASGGGPEYPARFPTLPWVRVMPVTLHRALVFAFKVVLRITVEFRWKFSTTKKVSPKYLDHVDLINKLKNFDQLKGSDVSPTWNHGIKSAFGAKQTPRLIIHTMKQRSTLHYKHNQHSEHSLSEISLTKLLLFCSKIYTCDCSVHKAQSYTYSLHTSVWSWRVLHHMS